MNTQDLEVMTKLIERINGMILNQFVEHDNELMGTYKDSGDDPVKISIGVKLSGTMDQIDAEVDFSFHTGRVKGKDIQTVYTRQQGLAFGGVDTGVDSIEFSVPGEPPVKITKEGARAIMSNDPEKPVSRKKGAKE